MDSSITEAVFIVCQEYNALNDANKSITNPPGFKDIREFCRKVQFVRDSADAQKCGAADVAAALAEVKPNVCFIFSSLHLFLILLVFLSFYLYTVIQPQHAHKTIKSKAIIDDNNLLVMLMSLWVHLMDPLLLHLVLMPCVSVSTHHSIAHSHRLLLTISSMEKLKLRSLPRTKARNTPRPR